VRYNFKSEDLISADVLRSLRYLAMDSRIKYGYDELEEQG